MSFLRTTSLNRPPDVGIRSGDTRSMKHLLAKLQSERRSDVACRQKHHRLCLFFPMQRTQTYVYTPQ